jgi:hypothetical protein
MRGQPGAAASRGRISSHARNTEGVTVASGGDSVGVIEETRARVLSCPFNGRNQCSKTSGRAGYGPALTLQSRSVPASPAPFAPNRESAAGATA